VFCSSGHGVNLRSQYEELLYDWSVIVLIRLAEPSAFSCQRYGVVVGMNPPLIDQADILPEHVGCMAIERWRDKGRVLERRRGEIRDDEL
jgi:hypothetical protein